MAEKFALLALLIIICGVCVIFWGIYRNLVLAPLIMVMVAWIFRIFYSITNDQNE